MAKGELGFQEPQAGVRACPLSYPEKGRPGMDENAGLQRPWHSPRAGPTLAPECLQQPYLT